MVVYIVVVYLDNEEFVVVKEKNKLVMNRVIFLG